MWKRIWGRIKEHPRLYGAGAVLVILTAVMLVIVEPNMRRTLVTILGGLATEAVFIVATYFTSRDLQTADNTPTLDDTNPYFDTWVTLFFASLLYAASMGFAFSAQFEWWEVLLTVCIVVVHIVLFIVAAVLGIGAAEDEATIESRSYVYGIED